MMIAALLGSETGPPVGRLRRSDLRTLSAAYAPGGLMAVVIALCRLDIGVVRAVYAVGAPHIDFATMAERFPVSGLARAAGNAVMQALVGEDISTGNLLTVLSRMERA